MIRTLPAPAPAALAAALAAVLATALAPPRALAQDPGYTLLDRGRLVTYHGNEPVGTERFLFEQNTDTLVVIAHATRRLAAPGGESQSYAKSMTLIARAADMGMLHYHSTERFGTHKVEMDVAPNDTMLVVNYSNDSRGESSWLERPPGRFFALDPGIYALFDVFARNLHGRLFGPRPAGLVMLGGTPRAVDATVAPAGSDTVRWGGRRVITQRVTLTDSTGVLDLWVSPEGHLLRLEDPGHGIVVMREAPEPPPAARRRKGATAR